MKNLKLKDQVSSDNIGFLINGCKFFIIKWLEKVFEGALVGLALKSLASCINLQNFKECSGC